MKGTRIVIPQRMRREMLELVHVGHLGAEKQKRLARDLLYWPNMNRDIDSNVQNCGVCQKYRRAQSKEPLLETECRKWGPWDRVGIDLMTWERKEYVVIIFILWEHRQRRCSHDAVAPNRMPRPNSSVATID